MTAQTVCEQITAEIISELERGVMPWSQPWAGGFGLTMPKRHNAKNYNGINVLILWSRAHVRGYQSPFWMTYQQALEYKANVRKGERGTQIIFANKTTKTETNSEGEDEQKTFSYLKTYSVFNAEQIDNLPDQFSTSTQTPMLSNSEAIDWSMYNQAEAWFDAIPVNIIHEGNRAYYMPSQDKILLPEREKFRNGEAYYSTRAHETIHWTKHENRLARDFGAKRFGDEGYAVEELTAELGAAFTMAQIGLIPQVREDHAPYISNWLKVLKNDHKVLMTAASKASQALEYLNTHQPS